MAKACDDEQHPTLPGRSGVEVCSMDAGVQKQVSMRNMVVRRHELQVTTVKHHLSSRKSAL